MKGFTDLGQSKKLVKFLPLESADMYWWLTSIRYYIESMDDGDFNEDEGHIRAWSLAALLNVFPNSEQKSVDVCHGGWKGEEYVSDWFCSYDDYEKNYFETTNSDNPIDACYEMIIKLHEKNLL